MDRFLSMPVETRCILLINSDPDIQEMIRLCLELIPGSKIIAVNSGIEAIERATVEPIDAILLDLDETIPDSSWLEIVKELNKDPLIQSIPLILLTFLPQSREIIKLQQSKQIVAIAKSFDLSNLAAQISVLLNWND